MTRGPSPAAIPLPGPASTPGHGSGGDSGGHDSGANAFVPSHTAAVADSMGSLVTAGVPSAVLGTPTPTFLEPELLEQQQQQPEQPGQPDPEPVHRYKAPPPTLDLGKCKLGQASRPEVIQAEGDSPPNHPGAASSSDIRILWLEQAPGPPPGPPPAWAARFPPTPPGPIAGQPAGRTPAPYGTTGFGLATTHGSTRKRRCPAVEAEEDSPDGPHFFGDSRPPGFKIRVGDLAPWTTEYWVD